MEAKAVEAEAFFRAFTACPNDIKTLILDVRPNKDFKKLHLNQAYCIRLSSNGKVLADYSQNSYELPWSNDCWWTKHVLLYGEAGLRRDHPVVEFLAKEGRCQSLGYYKDGFEKLQQKYPFLCTPSVKANSIKKFPSEILEGFLYLGDWSHAQASDRLQEINVRSIITIHNNPETLKPPPTMRHMTIALPDIDSADIAGHFNGTYEFIEQARAKGHGVLVHCGAGVSRSATLVMAYLMRRFTWPAQKAKEHCTTRRSLVCPNDGFWRTLCALEGSLGIVHRSDPTATMGFHGDDAPQELSEAVIGSKVTVSVVSAQELRKRKQQQEGSGDDGKDSRKRGRHEEASTSAGGTVPGGGGGGADSGGVLIVLEVSKPEGVVQQLELGPFKLHQRCTFGRQPSCDVVLEHQSLSRQHATLTVDANGHAFLTDLQSAHGTKLDDTWIKASQPKQLRPGMRISFGASTRTYKVLSIEKIAAVATADGAGGRGAAPAQQRQALR